MYAGRNADVRDAGELLDIYDHYVRDTAISFEYETPAEEEFRGRMENIMRRYPYLAVRRMGASGAMPKCGYKFGRWYNMVWAEKIICPHDEEPLPVIPFPNLKIILNV